MIRRCPKCGIDVHDYFGSGRLRVHRDRSGVVCPGSKRHVDAVQSPGTGGEPQQIAGVGPAVADSAVRNPQRIADLSRDDRTDLIVTAIENACECAAIEVEVHEEDGTVSPLRRLARCLDGAGLIDWDGVR